MIHQLAIDQLEYDMQLQPRAKLHDHWIEEYAEDMASGAEFPPIVVFFDNEHYWLADGFHRCYAAKAAGLVEINTDVRKGTRRDALLHSLSANAEHGHRRTNEDKRRAIDIMLSDLDWLRLPDNEIARRFGVDHKTVAKRRQSILGNSQDDRVVTHGNSAYKMDISRIGGGSNVGAEGAAAKPSLSLAAQGARPPEDQQQNLVHVDKAVPRDVMKASQPSAVEAPKTPPHSSLAPDTRRYGVLYADPWCAMSLEDLCAQPVPAAENSVLCLRARRPGDALRLMKSWGFACADHVVWNKGCFEPGRFVRYQHELFLIGSRGDALMPARGAELPSILCAASHKVLADQFAAMFPNLAKAELFTQTPRAGWDAWWPEVGSDDDDAVEAEHRETDLAAA